MIYIDYFDGLTFVGRVCVCVCVCVCVWCVCMYVVTDDPGSKPDKKYARRRDAKLRGNNKIKFGTSSKRICVQYTVTL